MAYEPVNNSRSPYDGDVELSTRYDAGSYNNTRPPNNAQDRDTKDRVEDTKDAFLLNEVPLGQWPSQSEHAATLTPWKISVMVFDAILASTPIMFIGKANLCLALELTPS